jgi:hypothetical protein
MNLSQTESAIGLFAYHQDHPGALLYARFYSVVLKELARVGVEPTYFGCGDGSGYKQFGGRAQKKVVDDNFQNIKGLSIAANPAGSNAPAYDSFFECAISFVNTSGFPQSVGGMVYSFFVINESFLLFGSEGFERILRELVDLFPWDFGMGFSDMAERHPEFHIGSLSHDKLTAEEREGGQAWYSTPPEIRLQMLRSIYPYNILNEWQLGQKIQPGFSLRQFIENGSIGTLEALPGGRLWLWKVLDHEQRIALRRQLHWKTPDMKTAVGIRQLQDGQVDLSQPGIVIDAATLIP